MKNMVALNIFYTISLFLFICFKETDGIKVLLKDVDTITLIRGQRTTARRSSPIPQLKCTGGSAGCRSFVPESVQCYNKGWDGSDIQWKCETEMNKRYRFGKIAVSCEGYDFANDPYILAGSCGLKYEIDYVNRKHASRLFKNSRSVKPSYYFSDFIWIFCGFLFILLMYRICTGRNNNRCRIFSNSNSSRETQPGTYPTDPPPPYGFRQEYFSQQNTSNFEETQQPGFFSGMAAGGLLGYVFGKETGYSRCDNSPGYHHSSEYNSSWLEPPVSSNIYVSSSESSEDDESRMAAGYGSTTRR